MPQLQSRPAVPREFVMQPNNPYCSPAPVTNEQVAADLPLVTGCVVCGGHNDLQRRWVRVNAGNYYVFYATNDNFCVQANCCRNCRDGLSRSQAFRYIGLAAGTAALAVMYFMPLGSSLLGIPRIVLGLFGFAMVIVAALGANAASRRRMTTESARRFKSCSKRNLPVRHLAIVDKPNHRRPQYVM